MNLSFNKSLMVLMRFAGHDYLFRVLLLENNQLFSLLIHLILQSIFLSIQGRDRLVNNSHFLLVFGVLLTQRPCQRNKNLANSRAATGKKKQKKTLIHQLQPSTKSTQIHLFSPPVSQSAHEQRAAHSSSQTACVGYQTATAPFAPVAACRHTRKIHQPSTTLATNQSFSAQNMCLKQLLAAE